MDKGEAHSKPGIGNLSEDSPVFPLASGSDIDQHRKLRLHGSYAPGRTPSSQPPASAPPHDIIHTGPPPLISNLMPIKSAKTIAEPQRNFAWEGLRGYERVNSSLVRGHRKRGFHVMGCRSRPPGWRGGARRWLAGRPLLRQTAGATFQPAPAPAC